MAKSLVAKNWSPTPRGRVYARTHGINETKLKEQVALFVETHRKKGNKYEDWDMAWQTWCRNHLKYNPPLKESSDPIISYEPLQARICPSESNPLPPSSPFRMNRMRMTEQMRAKMDRWREKAGSALDEKLEAGDLHGCQQAIDWFHEQMVRCSKQMGE